MQIVSGSRDKSIKLWNTLGECKYTWDAADSGHTDWVSCVRFSPVTSNPIIVSGGWDKQIKVWNLTKCRLQHNLVGHTGYINTVTVSPDGSLCASGGKDGTAMLWDLSEGKRLYMLDAGDIIHALCFSPMRCAPSPSLTPCACSRGVPASSAWHMPVAWAQAVAAWALQQQVVRPAQIVSRMCQYVVVSESVWVYCPGGIAGFSPGRSAPWAWMTEAAVLD